MLMKNDFWESSENALFLNPRISEEEKKKITQAVHQQEQEGSIWLLSSGTESRKYGTKVVCLEKRAVLVAARSVVDFFKVTSSDIWVCSIPDFHIGGVSIYARCFVAGAKVEKLKEAWDPEIFTSFVEDRNITIASLVPTQVHDLIESDMKAPKSLRFVLVGGGAIKEEQYKKARELGWPLIPSYGMTETSALMASATLESLESMDFPKAQILDHIRFEEESGEHSVHSEALFSGFLFIQEDGSFDWVPRENKFKLDDQIESDGKFISVLGRSSELVKILGESVNIANLEEKISKIIAQDVLILPVQDERKGYSLYLAIHENQESMNLEELNEKLLPFERITGLYVAESVPRNEMGKVQKSQIIEFLKERLRL